MKSLPSGPRKSSFPLPKNNSPNTPQSQRETSYTSSRSSSNYSSKNTLKGQLFTPNRPLPTAPGLLPKGPSALNSTTTPPRPTVNNKISFLKSIRDSTVYERIAQVGEGTYGKVYKAKNRVTGAYVALKRLRMESEKEGFPITAMRETSLLQSFNHPNIVPLLEIMVENKQIYMVFDYADHDLTGILSNPDVNLTDGNRKLLFKQLCEGLNYLHIKRVIHRDIKCSNLLIDRNGVLKIADFGLARKLKPVKSSDYTNRVITLWYRPPELLLGTTDYGREVDIWGIGCLLVELFTNKALFQAQDEIQQLHVIFQTLGTPTFEEWPNLADLPWYEMVKPHELYHSQFRKLYQSILSEKCYDLALRMLEYDPKKRITCKDALEHDYFKEDPKPEPIKEGTLSGEWHEFEAKKKRRKEREEKKMEEKRKRQKVESSKLGSEDKPSVPNTERKESIIASVPASDRKRSTVDTKAVSVTPTTQTRDEDGDVDMKDSDTKDKMPVSTKDNSPEEDVDVDVAVSVEKEEASIEGTKESELLVEDLNVGYKTTNESETKSHEKEEKPVEVEETKETEAGVNLEQTNAVEQEEIPNEEDQVTAKSREEPTTNDIKVRDEEVKDVVEKSESKNEEGDAQKQEMNEPAVKVIPNVPEGNEDAGMDDDEDDVDLIQTSTTAKND